MKNYWLDEDAISIDTCREVAARIWCDQEYNNVVMDVKVCEEIAKMLFKVATDI